MLADISNIWQSPHIDFHALAPEIVLLALLAVLVLVDSVLLERAKAIMPAITAVGLLAAVVPLLTLAQKGFDADGRSLFDGAYVVDPLSLVLKALFIVTGYVVVLLSTNYVAEGDYWEGEYYTLLVSSLLGMTVMASARDLISIFVALELLSIPAYMMSAWRKRDVRSNEAGLKYYLMGVFASAVLLYGMSLVYGVTGETRLDAIAEALREPGDMLPAAVLGMLLTVVGFGFKVSAVPFHNWAPDTYEGAPTPVTAFLAVASKAAGFVALINVVYFGFLTRPEVIRPLGFVLAVASMTIGNLTALRQTNVVRMLAYSGIAQAGFMLAPFAVLGAGDSALTIQAVVVYLVIYAAMNLGAFACVIAIARRTRSAEISSLRGLLSYAPGLTVMFSLFLASLIGIPPLGGWYAKFGVFNALVEAATPLGYATAIVMAVNTAIAAAYYLGVARAMWFEDAPDGDLTPLRVPNSLRGAMVICVIVTLVLGIVPQLITSATTALGPVALGG